VALPLVVPCPWWLSWPLVGLLALPLVACLLVTYPGGLPLVALVPLPLALVPLPLALMALPLSLVAVVPPCQPCSS